MSGLTPVKECPLQRVTDAEDLWLQKATLATTDSARPCSAKDMDGQR